jgi:hypothetical protein
LYSVTVVNRKVLHTRVGEVAWAKDKTAALGAVCLQEMPRDLGLVHHVPFDGDYLGANGREVSVSGRGEKKRGEDNRSHRILFL